MKKIFLGFFLVNMICLFVIPTPSVQAGKCIVATDFEGYKFIGLVGKQVILREKTLKKARLNDYKAPVQVDLFDNYETPENVTMSGNSAIAYVSTVVNNPDDDGADSNGIVSCNVYRYEKGKRSPAQPIWKTNSKINGLATNMNGGRLLAVTESKKLVYRSKDGNFIPIRTCAGIPTSIAMSSDGNFVFVVTGKNQLNKYTYDSAKDTYEYDNKGLWEQPEDGAEGGDNEDGEADAILGVSTNMDASKVWLITCKSHGWSYSLMEGSKEGNFKKLYEFDDTSYPCDVAISGNSKMAYIPLSFSYIYRFSYDPKAKCYVVYKLHY